jgi:hypothetical protein
MNSRKKKYHLLYLPSGRYIEICSCTKIDYRKGVYVSTYAIVKKNRTDLRNVLNKILHGQYPPGFYAHNELPHHDMLKNCHFIFERVVPLVSQEA